MDIGECWEFEGTSIRSGYPRIQTGSRKTRSLKTRTASRVVWLGANGPIPEGSLVCHHCDNRACIRLSHLYLGTYADNARDKVLRRRSRRKLTDEQEEAIRVRYSYGERGWRLAKEFGVAPATVSRIVRSTTRPIQV